MFVCGITPQDQTHLGHAKTYVAFDVVARYLRSKGYHVFYLQNVTDIEDRIIAKMKSTRRAWDDIVAQYFAEFRDVMERLQCTSVDVYAFATDYIDEIVEQIQGLIRKGHAYVAEDKSVYFDTTTFSGWGKLSGQKVEELRPGARIEIEERKRHPADFVLWRAQKPGEPAWESPWGPGRPGWHIECSAMAMKYLGASFDLHGGGEDLIFPHHECEIAQAEACTGKPFARYWVHNGMVNMGKEKMSKSLGNTLNIREIVKRHSPDTLRLWMLGTHYRNMIEWSEERVEESKRAFERLTRLRHDAAAVGDVGAGAPLPQAFAEFSPRFEKAMDDDFNTPQALGALFDFGRALAEARDRGAGPPGAFVAGVDELVGLGRVLGLFGREAATDGPPPEVQELLTARGQAR